MALLAIGEEIWLADGAPVSFYGFPYPTRMALVRLRDGSLWVWSPIELDDRLAEEVDALGPVRHLISPNKLHHLFLAAWAERWPDAKLYASPGLTSRRKELTFATELGDRPEPAWQGEIDQVVVRGSVFMEEVLFFHRSSSTCLVCDLVQRLDPSTQHGWRGGVMKLCGLVGPEGSTPLEWRASFLRRSAARAALEKALSWAPERLVIAHGDWVPEGGVEVLRRNLSWLKPGTT